MIYSNLNDKFILLDFHPSHSQLLIRSTKNNERDYNIDILFKPVDVILLPTKFKGLEVKVLDLEQKEEFIKKDFGMELNDGNTIFLLKDSEGRKCYLSALAMGVFHNKLDILETSIDPFDFEKIGKKSFGTPVSPMSLRNG